jgi:putative transposase
LPQVDGSRHNHTIQARRQAMRRGPSRSEVLRSLKERGLTEASQALAEAPTRQECERRHDGLCAWLRARGQLPAAACLERDWADFVTYYDFPEEHWVHLRTSNPIESIFSGVRLRTNASKRLRIPESALYLVFKLVLRLSLNWRGINTPNQLRLLLAGHQFRDGQLVLEDVRGPTLTQAVGA